MAESIDIIVKFWERDQPVYEKVGNYVVDILQERLYDVGIHIEISYRTKDTISLLKKIKFNSKGKKYSYNDISDKLGVRIICNYKEDLVIVDTVLREIFEVRKFEDKAEGLAEKEFSYTSFHYDLVLKDNAPVELQKYVFELQLRTISQHAWASTAHELSYKQDIKLPKNLNRKVFRLSALYEIADSELSSLNSYILNHPEFETYKLLKKLETPYYQGARERYNKEQSTYFLQLMLDEGIFDETDGPLLDLFIDENKGKFREIFSEYSKSVLLKYVVFQPETILIWYLLIKKEYKLQEFWNENLDSGDFEMIKNSWGVIDE